MNLLKDTIRRVVPMELKQTLMRYALSNRLEVILSNLVKRGFTAGSVIDVGAYEGEWTKTVSRIFPGVPFLMIEAQAEKLACLQKVARRTHSQVDIALLSDKAHRQLPFFLMKTGSSVYPENTAVPRTTALLMTQTLDGVVASHTSIVPPFLLKLDVQGYELEVLRGGTNTLGMSSFVLLEVPLLEYNAGAPDFDTVVAFMKERGFSIYSFVNMLPLPGSSEECQTDILFIRNSSSFRSKGVLPS